MTAATIDPTLTAGDPTPESLADGFSPPETAAAIPLQADGALPVEPAPGDKSPF